MTTPLADLPRADKFRPKGTPRPSKRARWRAIVLIGVHVAVLVHVAHWLGSGETISPLEPSEARETLEFGYINAGFLLLAVAILATLVLGRFFCGWICHFVAYQDFCAWICNKLGIKPRPMRSRLLVWVPLAAAVWLFFWPVIERLWQGHPSPAFEWRLTKQHFWETFPGLTVALLTIAIDGFLLVYWLGAKGFCTYGCPYGGLFGVADRFALGRIRVTDACEHCGHCTSACTSNVRVHAEVAQHGMVVDPGCMKCMDCVSTCPNDALYFGFGKPSFAKKKKRARPPADFSWGEEVAMAVMFVAGVAVTWGLYGYVPRLLAIGLGVLIALGGIVGWRLWRRSELRVQHRQLKQGGALTRAGLLAAVGLAACALLLLHSSVVRYHGWRGQALAEEAGNRHAHQVAMAEVTRRGEDPRPLHESRNAKLGEAFEHLSTAQSLGLIADPDLELKAALVQMERFELPDADRRLRRVLELRPGAWNAMVPLADVRMAMGDAEEAERLLREVLAERPDLEPAKLRLQALERSRGR